MKPATAAPAPRRQRARRGDGDLLREEILQAAERLLVATGDTRAVSMRAIAEAVGVTPPSIYLHFTDKDELLFEACQRRFDQLDEVLHRALDAETDPIARLRAAGRAYVEFGLAEPAAYRVMFMSHNEIPEGRSKAELVDASGFGRIVDAVGEAVDGGLVAPGEPYAIATHVWLLMHGLTSMLLTMADFPWPAPRAEMVEQLLDRTIAGLAPRP